MVRRDLMQCVHYPWDMFVHNCRRTAQYSWLEFCRVTTEHEIQETLVWMQSRPTSMFKMNERDMRRAITSECALWGADPRTVIAASLESPFTRALLCSEVRRLVTYREKAMCTTHRREFLVCLVGQLLGDHPQFSVGPILNTIIRKSVIVWAGPLGRPLTGMELMTTQGFVTDKSLSASNLLSSSFSIQLDRKRSSVGEQAGNSMPVNFVGLALMWAILAVDIAQPISLDPVLAKLVSLRKRKRD